MKKVGQYFYAIRGRCYRIYRYTEVTATGYSASPVLSEPDFVYPEEARKRVYELNGWKYVPKS